MRTLITITVTSFWAATLVFAAPKDETAWLSCQTNEECSSVKLGCYYWQPVNKEFEKQMTDKYRESCRMSIDAGPKPMSRCVRGICINDSKAASA